MNTLDLTPDMIVTPGERVVARRVESQRAKRVHADAAVVRLRAARARFGGGQ
jgi:hypothetical protein